MSRISPAIIEVLESRQLRTAVYPTAVEQYMVELVNRARANPTAEATRYNGFNDSHGNRFNGNLNEGLSAGTISATAKQPLAINPYLTDAARSHSQWMVDNDTFSHTGVNGSDTGTREVNAGYTGANTWGENIAADWNTGPLDAKSTVYDQHSNLFTDMTISGRGHRINLMNGTFKEIGIGVASGPWYMSQYGTMNSQTSTQDFGSKGTTFLTGVTYADTTTADNFYTPGEGKSGVTIKATRISDGQIFTTTSWTSGGYSLALAAGAYNIQASGGTLPATIYYNNVTVGSENVKKDFVAGQSSDPAPGGSTGGSASFAKLVDTTLVVTGTSAGDNIKVTKIGSNYVATMNGSFLSFPVSSVTILAVKAGAGNDTVVNATALPSYLEGSDGKDNLTGGVGADSIYGDLSIDYIDGGDGNDQLVGAGGNDIIKAGIGNDKIYAGGGNDLVDAGAGSDRVYGGDGNDSLYGVGGNDIIYGELGVDLLNGGIGSDTTDTDSLDSRIAIEVLV